MSKVAVVAVGGNSLIKSKEKQTVADQYAAAYETAEHIAEMIRKGWLVVVTHGNGPQVGFILRRSELSRHELHEVPLDSCGADSQGALGYNIQMALRNALRKKGIPFNDVVTVVTQVVVDKNDPAWQKPSKPIGSFMASAKEAEKRQKEDGWTVVEDAGRGFRRVVASPIPQEIVEQRAIEALIKAGIIVIAVGGGGIPVIRNEQGDLVGVEAVIDKDYASSLLASAIGADLLIISTAVDKVSLNYKKPEQKDLDVVTLSEAKGYLVEGHFADGSMGPKIKAVISFLEKGGKEAIVTSPEKIEEALEGKSGTRFVPDQA